MATKLVLYKWSNCVEDTKEQLKNEGNTILNVRKDGTGHLIKYRHHSLNRRPKRGDLIEYYDWNRKETKRILTRAIVNSTDNEYGTIKDHVGVKSTIIAIGDITRIIRKQIIPEKLFKYL